MHSALWVTEERQNLGDDRLGACLRYLAMKEG